MKAITNLCSIIYLKSIFLNYKSNAPLLSAFSVTGTGTYVLFLSFFIQIQINAAHTHQSNKTNTKAINIMSVAR